MTPSKPPLTKEQEKEKFHPHREGMPPAPRLAGYERRLQMEKESRLKGLRFRPVGPEIQGGRIVDIEAPPAHPDAVTLAFASRGLRRAAAGGRTTGAGAGRRCSTTSRRSRSATWRSATRTARPSTWARARTTPAAPPTRARACSRAPTAAGPGATSD